MLSSREAKKSFSWIFTRSHGGFPMTHENPPDQPVLWIGTHGSAVGAENMRETPDTSGRIGSRAPRLCCWCSPVRDEVSAGSAARRRRTASVMAFLRVALDFGWTNAAHQASATSLRARCCVEIGGGCGRVAEPDDRGRLRAT